MPEEEQNTKYITKERNTEITKNITNSIKKEG